MYVSYIYKTPLPSTTTASIQFVNTFRELCELGVSARIFVPRLEAEPEVCLQHYGLTPHPALQLERIPGFYNDASLGSRLRKMQESVPSGERHFFITRGEVGLRVFDQLRAIPRRPGERRIFEQHRLCWTFAAESRDRWRPPAASWQDFPEVVEIRRREAAAVADSDALVCNTEGTLRWLRMLGGPAQPSLVLRGGTTLADGPPAPDSKRDIDVFYVGKLKDRKGIPVLLAALGRLPEVRAVLAGGSEADLAWARDAAADNRVADRVELLGYVAPADLPPLLARVRVGVCPLPEGVSTISDEFTDPIKLATMMGHHVPIVSTDMPTVRAVVEDRETALLARPNDPRSLAKAIRRLLDDRELATRLAAEARRRAEAVSWSRRARRLHDFLDALP